MKFHKRRLQLWRLMLSWAAVASILWIPVAFAYGSWRGMSMTFNTIAALAPMLPILIKRREHFYIMKRNVDFDQYRLDK